MADPAQPGGTNDLTGDNAQALIRELLARNQELEQKLQQAKPQDSPNGHQADDTTPDAEQGDAVRNPETVKTEGEEPSSKPLKKDKGDEEESKARTCVDCDKTFPTLKALNRCSTCYQRLYKRRRRAMAQQHKISNASNAGAAVPAVGPGTMPRNALAPDLMTAMHQLQATHAPPMPLGPAATPTAPPGGSDDRLLLLLRIRALLEDCNRQDGDGRLTDIEGLLTSYMRMEESGRAGAAAAGAAAEVGHKRSAGDAFDQGNPDGDEAEEQVDRVINPNWESMPGTCNPNMEKAKTSRRRLRQVEVLLAVGLLHEGDVVTYKSRSGKIMAQGVVKGTGILCSRCSQLVGATEFEQCAGSGLRRPCENIYTAENMTLQDLLVQADKIMLDRANNVQGAEAPRAPAPWANPAANPVPFGQGPGPLLPGPALPQLAAGHMDLNALRQAAYAGGAAAALGMPPAFAANQFADPGTLQNLQAMFGGAEDSSDDGDSSAEGDGQPPGGIPPTLANMLPGVNLQAFANPRSSAGLAANMLMEQYAALDPSRRGAHGGFDHQRN